MRNLRYLWYNGSVARVAPEKQVPACLPLNNNRELLREVIKMGKTKTHEQFISEVEGLAGNEYTVIGTYTKGHDKIKLKHNICGYIYDQRASAFLYGARCPKCANNLPKTNNQFEEQVYELVKDEYIVKSKYISFHQKVTMYHQECGTEYEVSPAHFLINGRRCPRCNGGVRLNDTEFKKYVQMTTGDEYEVLDEYKNNKTHVTMEHKECGTIWKIRPDNFKSGKRCPYCNQSRGEKKIEDILKENKIDFERQYKIKECKNKRALPFDFAIFKDNQLTHLIEFNGEQHYRIVDYFGGQRGYLMRIKNDEIKKTFCKENNIPLLIINCNDNIKTKINTTTIMSQAYLETVGRCND